MLTVISYDIPSDRRRRKVAKLLLDYGYRVQYSVFEADLDSRRLNDMMARLSEEIDEEEDSVRVWRICATCKEQRYFLGMADEVLPGSVVII